MWAVCAGMFCVFFFNDTATTEIYTLSLHDALPICMRLAWSRRHGGSRPETASSQRSEEHTSELQSRSDLVCRLLLEKKTRKNQFQQRLCGATTEITANSSRATE